MKNVPQSDPRFQVEDTDTDAFYDFEPGDLVSWDQYEFTVKEELGSWQACRTYGYYVGPGKPSKSGEAIKHRILDEDGNVRDIPDYNDFKIEQKRQKSVRII